MKNLSTSRLLIPGNFYLVPNLHVEKRTGREITAYTSEGVVVDINNPHISHPPGYIPVDAQGSEHLILQSDANSPLSRSAANATLQTVITKLQAALDQLSEPTQPVMEILTENVRLLQECFMQCLYAELSALGVDISAKLTLRLDKQAKLVVCADHPDHTKVHEFLLHNPEYATAFTEIAIQCATLRDLRSLHTVAAFNDSTDSYACLAQHPGENTYQLSLKGEMNHFYFTR